MRSTAVVPLTIPLVVLLLGASASPNHGAPDGGFASWLRCDEHSTSWKIDCSTQNVRCIVDAGPICGSLTCGAGRSCTGGSLEAAPGGNPKVRDPEVGEPDGGFSFGFTCGDNMWDWWIDCTGHSGPCVVDAGRCGTLKCVPDKSGQGHCAGGGICE